MLFGILVCLAKISQWRQQRRPKERGSIILHGRWQNDEWITRSDISWITRRDISGKVWRIEQDFFHRIIERTRTRGSTSWRDKVFLATERYRIARWIESIGGIVIQSAGTKNLTTPRGTYKVAGDNWKSSFFVTKTLGGCKRKRKKKEEDLSVLLGYSDSSNVTSIGEYFGRGNVQIARMTREGWIGKSWENTRQARNNGNSAKETMSKRQLERWQITN